MPNYKVEFFIRTPGTIVIEAANADLARAAFIQLDQADLVQNHLDESDWTMLHSIIVEETTEAVKADLVAEDAPKEQLLVEFAVLGEDRTFELTLDAPQGDQSDEAVMAFLTRSLTYFSLIWQQDLIGIYHWRWLEEGEEFDV